MSYQVQIQDEFIRGQYKPRMYKNLSRTLISMTHFLSHVPKTALICLSKCL